HRDAVRVVPAGRDEGNVVTGLSSRSDIADGLSKRDSFVLGAVHAVRGHVRRNAPDGVRLGVSLGHVLRSPVEEFDDRVLAYPFPGPGGEVEYRARCDQSVIGERGGVAPWRDAVADRPAHHAARCPPAEWPNRRIRSVFREYSSASASM